MLVLWPVHELESEQSQYLGIMTLSAMLKAQGHRSEVVPTDERLIAGRIASEDRAVVAFSTPSALATTYISFNKRLKERHPDLFSVFGGAHPTSCTPLYGFDVPHFKAYAASAKEENGIQGYLEQFLGDSEEDYQQRVGGLDAIRALKLPTY